MVLDEISTVKTTSVAASLPHSREAEEAVIGAVLINPDCYAEVRTILTQGADEFYIHRLRFVWQAYERLLDRHMPIDNLTVAEELDDMGRLSEIGGPAFLTALLNQVPTTLHVAGYAQIVHATCQRRNLLTAANAIAALAYDEALPQDDVMSRATRAVSNVVRQSSTAKQVISLHDSVKAVDDLVVLRSTQASLPGIPTGLIDLDRKLGGGAYPSELNILAGRPGHGKTSALLQAALHAAHYEDKLKMQVVKKRVAFFSLEMPHEQLTMRLISQLTGIQYQVIRAGRIPESQIQAYFDAISFLSNLDLVIDSTSGASPAYIWSRCEILAAEGLDIAFVDSLNLMKSGMNFSADYKEADYCASELKNMAKDLNIPVWCAHQMNRGIEQRGNDARPKLSDLRDGGEQPADGVIFIHGKEQADNTVTDHELVIAKSRNGPIGIVPVVFQSSHFKFYNAVKVNP